SGELRDLQIAIKVGPFERARFRVIEPIDTSIVPVEQLTVGIEIESVNVCVGPTGDHRPGVATISALDDAGAAEVRGSPDVNDIRVGWVYSYGNVIPALSGFSPEKILPT